MGQEMKRIEEAIVSGKVDERWQVKKEDHGSKELAPKGSDGKQAWPKDQYTLNATYKNASGAPLLSFAVTIHGDQRQLHFAHFKTKVGNKDITLNDIHRDHALGEPHYAGGGEADGKVSGGDEILIGQYCYELVNKDEHYVQGDDPAKSVFVLSGYSGELLEAKSGKPLPAADPRAETGYAEVGVPVYHGLEFKRESGQWKFQGPQDRQAQGREIESLLNQVEAKYSSAVTEAVQHLK